MNANYLNAICVTVAMFAFVPQSLNGQNLQKGDYGFLY